MSTCITQGADTVTLDGRAHGTGHAAEIPGNTRVARGNPLQERRISTSFHSNHGSGLCVKAHPVSQVLFTCWI